MAKRFATAFDGTDEVIRSRKQDEAFCRILRAAIERGHESCPIGVSTEPSVNVALVNTDDDHKAYMREYMRRRRASTKQPSQT
jgi:hypothetical protein